jgi:hypothetical protein
MSQQHDRITRRLDELGMTWATRSDRYCDANDPLEDQIAGRKTYHIHPDRANPRYESILRFTSLREIEAWLDSLPVNPD